MRVRDGMNINDYWGFIIVILLVVTIIPHLHINSVLKKLIIRWC